MVKNKSQVTKASDQSGKRTYIKQTDVPLFSLDEALRVPRAIIENYAEQPTSPFNVAKALNLEPKGSRFVNLTGAAIAYGLIEGGAQATTIIRTPLAKRIFRTTGEIDDIEARREALLKPRVFGEFLGKYDGHTLPREDIARNVLMDMGVPTEKAGEVLTRIIESATSAGFIEELKGKRYINLEGVALGAIGAQEKPESLLESETTDDEEATVRVEPEALRPAYQIDEARRKRVFISHGKNKAIIPPMKKLLEYGELEPVVSVEKQSVSKAVPEKVMGEMGSCGAGIIHVEAEKTIIDKQDEEHVILNPNVLVEIGAAMAFYGRRFILLVREGVKLPSNLQGLYEVRYAGDSLDADVTIRLLEAIKDIKNYPLPGEEPASR